VSLGLRIQIMGIHDVTIVLVFILEISEIVISASIELQISILLWVTMCSYLCGYLCMNMIGHWYLEKDIHKESQTGILTGFSS